jgi:hypothetical protein
MLKFFRQIRQHLFMESRIGKYFLYALGEILLVVLGILIALQINDWNDGRKNKLAEEIFFVKILEDLEKDESKLAFYEEFHTKRIEYLDTLLTYVRNPGRTMGIKKFGQYVEPLFYSATPTINSTTFESAKSSNVFNSFQEKGLIDELSRYYAEFGLIENSLNSITRFIETHFEPLLYTLPESYMTVESGDLVINEGDVKEFYEKIASIKDTRNLTPDYERILRTPVMENYLIGDMGRSYNALSRITARRAMLIKLKGEIKGVL